MRQACADGIFELASVDPRVVFVGSDLGPGAMEPMRLRYPERFFMEGVSEQYIIGMAAGLAATGFIPFVNSIGTFLTCRGFEQIAIDLCLQNLPVRLIGNGGGLVYASLGPTHLATEDLAILRALPNMTVVAPCDSDEAVGAPRPVPRLAWPGLLPTWWCRRSCGEPRPRASVTGPGGLLPPTRRVLVVSTGTITGNVVAAADLLTAQGVAVGVLHLSTVKPLDGPLLRDASGRADLVVVVEEHTPAGGLAGAVLESLADEPARLPGRFLRLGLPDEFISQYGSQRELLGRYGLDPVGLADRIERAWRAKRVDPP